MLIAQDEYNNRFEYFEEENIIVFTPTRVIGEKSKEGFNKCLEIFKNKKCTRWFADHRNYSESSAENLKWFSEVWTPQAIQNGFKFWAVLEKEDTLPEFSFKAVAEQFTRIGVETKVFTNLETAKSWIKNKK